MVTCSISMLVFLLSTMLIAIHRWCNPCKMLSPILEKLTADEAVKTGSGKSIDLVTVDTDAEVELAQEFQVSTNVDLWSRGKQTCGADC